MACKTFSMTMKRKTKLLTIALLCLAFAAPASISYAGGDHDDGEHNEGYTFGFPGEFENVDRIITIEAGDLFFNPESLDIKVGETIQFLIENVGDVGHEVTLGPKSIQEEHRMEMQHMVDSGTYDGIYMSQAAAHTDWNAVMVNAGERRSLIWTFSAPGEVEFGCNVPGHYESGMVGTIKVQS